MDDIDIPQRPPPYPYRSRSASASLPSYRAQRRQDEETLVFQPVDSRLSPTRYLYATPSMSLDLGQRQLGVSIPAYGNNATVQGTLTVKDLKHVSDVTLSITGKAAYTILECGYPILQHSKTVLNHSAPLWSSSHSQSLRQTSETATIPISFPLPTYARWSSALLPPTTRFVQGNFKLTVTYEIAVQLNRHGRLRRDERLAAEFAYAPRSIPDAGLSNGSSCRSETVNPENVEESKVHGGVRWKVVTVKPTTPNPPANTSILLHLPSPTSYASGTSIPFRILISSPPACEISSLPTRLKNSDALSIELVKLISFRIGKTPVLIENILGRGVVRKVEAVPERTGEWEATGCIEGIKKGGETSWGLGSFVDCSYVIRTTVNLPVSLGSPQTPPRPISRTSSFAPRSLVRSTSTSSASEKPQRSTYRHDEVVHLCTDEVETFEVEADDAWERPAMGLLPNAGDFRTSVQPTTLGSKGRQLLKRVCSGMTTMR